MKATVTPRSVAQIEQDITALTALTPQQRLLGGLSNEQLARLGRLRVERQASERHFAKEAQEQAAAANTQAAAKRAKREARVLDQLSFSPDLQEQVRALLATK
jgi:hypothetical protein